MESLEMRSKGGWAVLCVAAVAAVIAIVVLWKPILIRFYVRRMAAAFQAADTEVYWHCRDRLTALGYLRPMEFTFHHIDAPTEESSQLWRLVLAATPNGTSVEMDHPAEPKPAHVTVWDRPERLPAWQELFAGYDVPDFAQRFGTEEADAGPQ